MAARIGIAGKADARGGDDAGTSVRSANEADAPAALRTRPFVLSPWAAKPVSAGINDRISWRHIWYTPCRTRLFDSHIENIATALPRSLPKP